MGFLVIIFFQWAVIQLSSFNVFKPPQAGNHVNHCASWFDKKLGSGHRKQSGWVSGWHVTKVTYQKTSTWHEPSPTWLWHANRLATSQTSRQTLMEADTEEWGFTGADKPRQRLTDSEHSLNTVLASRVPLGIQWERALFGPFKHWLSNHSWHWVSGQADWLHTTYQLKGYSWREMTCYIPVLVANCWRRAKKTTG